MPCSQAVLPEGFKVHADRQDSAQIKVLSFWGATLSVVRNLNEQLKN